METTIISKCCNVEIKDVDNNSVNFICPKCENVCEIEEVCAYCLGTGEVTSTEQVYPGEPPTASIGVQSCICQKREDVEE